MEPVPANALSLCVCRSAGPVPPPPTDRTFVLSDLVPLLTFIRYWHLKRLKPYVPGGEQHTVQLRARLSAARAEFKSLTAKKSSLVARLRVGRLYESITCLAAEVGENPNVSIPDTFVVREARMSAFCGCKTSCTTNRCTLSFFGVFLSPPLFSPSSLSLSFFLEICDFPFAGICRKVGRQCNSQCHGKKKDPARHAQCQRTTQD